VLTAITSRNDAAVVAVVAQQCSPEDEARRLELEVDTSLQLCSVGG